MNNLDEIASRVPVQKRARKIDVSFKKGSQLLKGDRRIREAVRGPPGVGKSFTVFSMAQDHIVDRAPDDAWIKEFFDFNPQQQQVALEGDLGLRRAMLLSAHKIVVMDFDNLGMTPLFRTKQCDPRIFDQIEYFNITNWEEAHATMEEALNILGEHSKTYGKKGCWIVIDNMQNAWDLCRSDYLKAQIGQTLWEFMAEQRLKHPSKGTDGWKARAAAMGSVMNYDVINPSHNEEWLNRMANADYNMLLFGPNKAREEEVVQADGTVTKEQVPTLAGAKANPHVVDFIWRKWKDKQGVFKAQITKSRDIGFQGRILTKPTWKMMREEHERAEREFLAKKEAEYNRVIFGTTPNALQGDSLGLDDFLGDEGNVTVKDEGTTEWANDLTDLTLADDLVSDTLEDLDFGDTTPTETTERENFLQTLKVAGALELSDIKPECMKLVDQLLDEGVIYEIALGVFKILETVDAREVIEPDVTQYLEGETAKGLAKRLKKLDLVAMAERFGLETTGKKEDLAGRIVIHQQTDFVIP